MKSRKFMRFILSLFIAFTITCTSAEITSAATSINYESEMQLLEEELEKSPLDNLKEH